MRRARPVSEQKDCQLLDKQLTANKRNDAMQHDTFRASSALRGFALWSAAFMSGRIESENS